MKTKSSSDLEKVIVSILMWSVKSRLALLNDYSGFTSDPGMLCGDVTAQRIALLALAAKGRYTSANLAADAPDLEQTADWKPRLVFNAADMADESRFQEYCETLRQQQKKVRLGGVLRKRLQDLPPVKNEEVDAYTRATQDRITAISTVGSVPFEPDSDKSVERLEQELAQGKHKTTMTGVQAVDDITGGLHISPGEFVIWGGYPKIARKSTCLRNVVSSLLEKEPDFRAVWVTNEPSFGPNELTLDFIAQEATRWYRKHKDPSDPEWGFNHDLTALALADPNFFQSYNLPQGARDSLAEAVQQARERVWNWKERRRTYGTGIKEGNTLDLGYTIDRVRIEVEMRGANFVVVDNLQQWLNVPNVGPKGLNPNEKMGYIIGQWTWLQSQYHVAMVVVSQYSREGNMLYGGAAEYATNLWLESCLAKAGTSAMGKATYSETELNLRVERGRWVGMNKATALLDKHSGLIVGVKPSP